MAGASFQPRSSSLRECAESPAHRGVLDPTSPGAALTLSVGRMDRIVGRSDGSPIPTQLLSAVQNVPRYTLHGSEHKDYNKHGYLCLFRLISLLADYNQRGNTKLANLLYYCNLPVPLFRKKAPEMLQTRCLDALLTNICHLSIVRVNCTPYRQLAPARADARLTHARRPRAEERTNDKE